MPFLNRFLGCLLLASSTLLAQSEPEPVPYVQA